MGKLTGGFNELGQLLTNTPKDSLETFIIYSYLDNGDLSTLNYSILIDWFNAIKGLNVQYSSVNSNLKDVLKKHLNTLFLTKLNSNWTDDEWAMFEVWSLSFEYTDFLAYLHPNKRVCFAYN